MRRRREAADLTAPSDVVALYHRALDEARALHLDDDDARRYLHEVLKRRGTDAVEVFRARLWIRRGRTGDGWRW